MADRSVARPQPCLGRAQLTRGQQATLLCCGLASGVGSDRSPAEAREAPDEVRAPGTSDSACGSSGGVVSAKGRRGIVSRDRMETSPRTPLGPPLFLRFDVLLVHLYISAYHITCDRPPLDEALRPPCMHCASCYHPRTDAPPGTRSVYTVRATQLPSQTSTSVAGSAAISTRERQLWSCRMALHS